MKWTKNLKVNLENQYSKRFYKKFIKYRQRALRCDITPNIQEWQTYQRNYFLLQNLGL